MNRSETKKLLPIMQAYAEGKTIQSKALTGNWKDVTNPDWDMTRCYRIKPEPTYRPFKDTEECWKEMQKHQPFGWVKKDEHYFQITSITYSKPFKRVDLLIDEAICPTEYYFNEGWTFADGTPFGMKE